MWDLPRSGIEPMSNALASGFFTTEPPGKLHRFITIFNSTSLYSLLSMAPSTHTHTHTHTHTCTHTHTHAHAHTDTHTHTHIAIVIIYINNSMKSLTVHTISA